MKEPTLAAWQAQPNLARSLAEFLESKEGTLFMAVLKHEFGPSVDVTPVVAGVDYTQVYAFRASAYEACAKVFKTIRQMAVPRPPKPEPGEPKPGFHTQLRREPEREPAPAPVLKSPPRKKK